MSTDKKIPKENNEAQDDGVYVNNELGIKKVRTFAEDLAEAKRHAGIKQVGVAKKKINPADIERLKKDLESKVLSSNNLPGLAGEQSDLEYEVPIGGNEEYIIRRNKNIKSDIPHREKITQKKTFDVTHVNKPIPSAPPKPKAEEEKSKPKIAEPPKIKPVVKTKAPKEEPKVEIRAPITNAPKKPKLKEEPKPVAKPKPTPIVATPLKVEKEEPIRPFVSAAPKKPAPQPKPIVKPKPIVVPPQPKPAPIIAKKPRPIIATPPKVEKEEPVIETKTKSSQPNRDEIEKALRESGLIQDEKHKINNAESTIRTYKHDAFQSIKDRKLSPAGIIALEQKKKQAPQQFAYSAKNILSKNMLISIASISIISIGFAIIWFTFGASDEVLVNSGNTPLVLNDKKIKIDVPDNEVDIIGLLNEKYLSIGGDYNELVVFELVSSETGQKISKENLFDGMGYGVPGTLIRSLDEDFEFGVHVEEENYPFFILKTDSFKNAFAGMLEWEENMSSALSPLFTEGVNLPLGGVEQKFKDVLIKNKDTRILKSLNGKIVIIYGFVNTNTVIITASENTFFEVFDRLISTNDN